MVRRSWLYAPLAGAATFLFLTAISGDAVSQRITEVFVANFPDVWRVEGRVSVDGPVLLSELKQFEQIVVPPVKPNDTTRLVEAGTLVTDGFPNVVLSLHGLVKGKVNTPGDVGALLIPDEESIQDAFNEDGLVHFAMQVTAPGVRSETPFFASNQPRHRVGFHAYKVYLFNSTDKTVTVNLYAYLTN
jgi:hypothetical protein